jgi:hypothetical protein
VEEDSTPPRFVISLRHHHAQLYSPVHSEITDLHMPRNAALDQLCSYENLLWAWRKVAVFCETSDTWYDEGELREFELNLRENLLGIAEDFRRATYRTSALKPLPQPKRDSDGNIELRQAF